MSQPLLSFEEALSRVENFLSTSTQRVIIGIVGKPGAGKSTLSDFLMQNLPSGLVALVPMDGYHLSNKVLNKTGKIARKGAPDTFDARGYSDLLKTITVSSETIYFPIFHREIEESIAAEGQISAETKVVITEGNYLLHQSDGWQMVRDFLTEAWYVEVDDGLRLERLVDRHELFGKERAAAIDWAHGTDEKNAQLVEASKVLADFLVLNTDK